GDLVGAEREERGDAPEAREGADRTVGKKQADSAVPAPCSPIAPLKSARAACASRLRRRRRRVRPQEGEPAALKVDARRVTTEASGPLRRAASHRASGGRARGGERVPRRQARGREVGHLCL